jgi:hypothetical protein
VFYFSGVFMSSVSNSLRKSSNFSDPTDSKNIKMEKKQEKEGTERTSFFPKKGSSGRDSYFVSSHYGEYIPPVGHKEKEEIKFTNGDSYQGSTFNGTPHGFGKMRCAVSTDNTGKILYVVYIGQFEYGRSHGVGKKMYHNGDTYIGEFKYGEFCGVGKYIWSDGRIFKGAFENGKIGDAGEMTWPSGDVYKGQFDAAVQKHGWGRMTYKSGDVYEGEFKNNTESGCGEIKLINGFSYRGQIANNDSCGYGEVTYPNGSKRRNIM